MTEDEEWIAVATILQEIREVYLTAQRDWVVAFSGGKDSTATLQLIWYALTALPPEQRRFTVYVVSNDTLVEDPAMALRARKACARINAAASAEAQALAERYPEAAASIVPLFSAHMVQPEVFQRFFYLLIGLGYPSPTIKTRWCVDRLKLAPARAFIERRISLKGEVVITLGAREEESTTRARSLRKHALPGQLLKRHSSIQGAWVYTPIEVWDTDDVWQYLLGVQNPWGEENRDLLAIYQASTGECPLVVDTKVSSCAGSRTGCWTCTVARENRSLENRVDSGEEWLIPFLQFRHFLMQTVDPEQKHRYRTLEARGTHLVQLNRQGKPSYRCYTLETRKELLRRLLQVQEQVRREGPDPAMELVSWEELCAIREVWRREGDWEDTLPQIYQEVTGREADWPIREDERWMNAETKQTLLYHCQCQHLPARLVLELLEAMRQFQRVNTEPLPPVDTLSDLTIAPLFEVDPATARQQDTLQQLLETIGALLLQRDWRPEEERLAEVLARHQEDQGSSEITLPSWIPERRKKDQ